MRIGTSYKQHRDLADRWDAIVIGSGIGGLAAAAALSKLAGKRVLVLERHYTAGGFTHTFRRPGYEWDVGVHYIGEVSNPRSAMRRVFDFVTDGGLEWADMGDVYDRIIIDDRTYDFVKGRERFREKLHGYFPKETRAIDEYLEKIRATSKKGQLFFAEKAMPGLVSSVFGGLMRRPVLKEARVTTRQVLESLTQDQELIGVLTGQWGDYGLVPAESSFFIHALVATHYLKGAAYPIGGASRIAATILPVIEAAGGEVVTNANVQRVLIEEGRAVGVVLEDGRELRAPLVVSDAGVANTYGRLLPNDIAEGHGLRPKLEVIEPSVAHLSAYIGLRGTTEELGLEKTNLWVYPTPHHEENVRRFIADKNAPPPVVYLSFPSAKDPDFQRRYPGRSTIEAITLAPYAWFESWENTAWKKRGADYDAFKGELEARLLETLYEQAPATRGKVEVCELSTPLTTRNFANHPRGEIYGLAHTPARFEQRWLRPRTPIKGLFLTGADICSAGVGGALMGGMLCSSAVLGRNVLGTVLQRKAQSLRDTAASHEASAHA
ncbi:MAG: NAD(P)/FAD-dependent oxidoreductase [Myxococcales bacterium]|nr:NAD(P)/FAD-dependent oxidoreductase [Myxococcales bacterium]MDH3844694.1 NAD(P)/FAD-dependent oxidoreductase [Myxococcales bacterium]